MSVTAPDGWLAAGVRAGTKASGKPDLALVLSDRPATVAGAFTTNRVVGAPLIDARPKVARGTARCFVVSAGVANVATGQRGLHDTARMAAAAADACGTSADQVLVSCTGVIGEYLPIERVEAGIKEAASALARDGGQAAAAAILTTDRHPKTASRTVRVGDGAVTIGAMAKGAGMIAPRMTVPQATMLCYLTTDAAAEAAWLREVLADGIEDTFNAITIDGCMSTSDTVLMLANGASGIDATGSSAFADAAREVMAGLAYAVVADGEGATRVIRCRVTGASSVSDAKAIAREIAASQLVRCAIGGGDPNWGRIAQAAGQANAVLDQEAMRITVAGVHVATGGGASGAEAEAAAAMAGATEVVVEVDAGAGAASAEVLTCDLTESYVRFNTEYTT